MRVLSLDQPWASLVALQQPCPACAGIQPKARERVEGGAVGCGYCNRTFTFNFMRDQSPYECSCAAWIAARTCPRCLNAGTVPVKWIETRSQRAPKHLIGQRIAIAATKRVPARTQVGDYKPSLASRFSTHWDLWAEARHLRHTCVPMPLGAIVCTVVLADSLPMIGQDDEPTGRHIAPAHLGAGTRWYMSDRTLGDVTDITDQAPYGFFAPGRWGHLLTDIEPLDTPDPFKGGQGWSRSWEPPA